MPDIIKDFHLHTHYSDGLNSPAFLLEQAKSRGVRELAITDHNITSGLEEGERAAQELGLSFLSGVELSAHYGGREIHILGYGFDPWRRSSFSPLFRYMGEIQLHQHRWLHDVVELSQRQPIAIGENGNTRAEIFLTGGDIERFSRSIPSGFSLGIMVKEKLEEVYPEFREVPARHIYYFLFWRDEPVFLKRYGALFAKYGVENRKYWDVESDKVPLKPSEEVIDMLLAERGFPAVAHPGEMRIGEAEIADLASMGLKGVEVYTPKHDAAHVGLYENLAEKFGLLKISGTDYHDPYFRAKVDMGRDRDGNPLIRGAGIADIRGACGASSSSPLPKRGG